MPRSEIVYLSHSNHIHGGVHEPTIAVYRRRQSVVDSSAVVFDTLSQVRRYVQIRDPSQRKNVTVLSSATQQQLHEVFPKQHVD